jgi:hypothetical protein
MGDSLGVMLKYIGIIFFQLSCCSMNEWRVETANATMIAVKMAPLLCWLQLEWLVSSARSPIKFLACTFSAKTRLPLCDQWGYGLCQKYSTEVEGMVFEAAEVLDVFLEGCDLVIRGIEM